MYARDRQDMLDQVANESEEIHTKLMADVITTVEISKSRIEQSLNAFVDK